MAQGTCGGKKLVQFCQKQNLKIVNIFFKKRSGKRWTWVASNQQFKSQIYYILAPPHTFNLISNFDISNKFTFRSDHHPIFIKIAIKKFGYFTKKHNQNTRTSKHLNSQYQAKLDQNLEEVLARGETLDWNHVKKALTEASKEVSEPMTTGGDKGSHRGE